MRAPGYFRRLTKSYIADRGPDRCPPNRRLQNLELRMTEETAYTPPKVWKWIAENGGRFASTNRPIGTSG